MGFGLWAAWSAVADVSDAGIDDVPVTGTAADVARGLRDVADAGAQMILLNPVGATVAEDREQMEVLAAEVLPHVE